MILYAMKHAGLNFSLSKDELNELKAIIQYTGMPKVPDVLSWQELLHLGENEPDDELNECLKQIAINQCCHLIYTSGTTGHPKGVMLSHDNIIVAADLFCKLPDGGKVVGVSYLPLSHIAANILDVYAVSFYGGAIYFADKSALKGTLVETLKEVKPTYFFGVPRVWEKIHEKMLAVGRQNNCLKTFIANWAKSAGLTQNFKKFQGETRESIQYKIARALVFENVKSALGLSRTTM